MVQGVAFDRGSFVVTNGFKKPLGDCLVLGSSREPPPCLTDRPANIQSGSPPGSEVRRIFSAVDYSLSLGERQVCLSPVISFRTGY